MNEPSRREIRISDVDRSDAISALGEHFADGRLTMTEYEERVQQATAAVSEGELEKIFSDLPKLEASRELVPYYSAREIDRMYRSGRNMRLGLLLSTVIGSSALAMLVNSVWANSAILLLLIPLVFVLLYVMKVDPQSWYEPSPEQLERQRFRELKMQQRAQQAQWKFERKQRTHQLTSSAMKFAQKRLNGTGQ
ncbi:hypothetical membrane protein [Corynebacterium jeikeium]|uniref:DUF1707 domain-containing protein n=1 Tax=Corynebacterium jeikeium (strain K411) TaxID=306537 RepID=Q4JTK8_CORJK|nr:DUF1707 domain-containing protein [Corynebacterium jeikeium]CAI37849.1 hypothetical protein jk1672 [Corynebacterium jeikeium K411]SUY84813.1 hypothetical membrane protein [Corynebacterium jeikeium]